MVDIAKQIKYWREGAEEDFAAAGDLLDRGRIRQALFFTHLSLEKILKAHVCRHTADIAPKIHNLVRLAELAGINLSSDFVDILAEMNVFDIEGRYPEMLLPPPTSAEAKKYYAKTEEVFQWLQNQLQAR